MLLRSAASVKETRWLVEFHMIKGKVARQAQSIASSTPTRPSLEHSPKSGPLTRCLCLHLILLILTLLFAMRICALLRRPAAVWALIHRGGSAVSAFCLELSQAGACVLWIAVRSSGAEFVESGSCVYVKERGLEWSLWSTSSLELREMSDDAPWCG